MSELEGKPNLIHPDFSIQVFGTRFFQNKSWNRDVKGGPPQIKLIFSFDEPALLDEVSFVAKVSPNIKDGERYFAVFYGTEEDKKALVEWAKKNVDASLLTYEGKLMEKINRQKDADQNTHSGVQNDDGFKEFAENLVADFQVKTEESDDAQLRQSKHMQSQQRTEAIISDIANVLQGRKKNK